MFIKPRVQSQALGLRSNLNPRSIRNSSEAQHLWQRIPMMKSLAATSIAGPSWMSETVIRGIFIKWITLKCCILLVKLSPPQICLAKFGLFPKAFRTSSTAAQNAKGETCFWRSHYQWRFPPHEIASCDLFTFTEWNPSNWWFGIE